MTIFRKTSRWVAMSVVAVSCLSVHSAFADGAPPQGFWNSVKFFGHADGGVSFNPAVQAGGENYGDSFTDKANQLQLNQLMGTMERDIDSNSPNFNWGFKLQGLYGTDARYTQSLAETDHMFHSRYQFQFNEASVSLHFANLFEGGVDLKIGQMPSPMGVEANDATLNSLYSHSYLFNFSPFKSTGVIATAHVSPTLDLYGGFDTGLNGGITADGDNNANIKGQFGFGLNNLLGGDLTILAISHVGTENPANVVPKGAMRYINDVNAIYKANDKLTLTTDVDYMEEDSNNAIAYGVAQYAAYVLNDKITLVGRTEVWRDNAGYFASADPGYFDNANAQRGLPNTAYSEPRTTYGEITLGVNYKPEVPKAVEGVVLRPELRVDHSLNGSRPFDSGKDSTSFTPAVDMIVPF